MALILQTQQLLKLLNAMNYLIHSWNSVFVHNSIILIYYFAGSSRMEVPSSLILFYSQVAHMTKSEMHLHDTAFIGPALLFLDQYFNSFIDEYIVLWIALVCIVLLFCKLLVFLFEWDSPKKP